MPNEAPTQCGLINYPSYCGNTIAGNLMLAKMVPSSVTRPQLNAAAQTAVAASLDPSAIEADLRRNGMIKPEVGVEPVVKIINATLTVTEPVKDFSCCLNPSTGKWQPWDPSYGWVVGESCTPAGV